MPNLPAIVSSATMVVYLLNLAIAAILVCAAGLLAARAVRRGSAPLPHGILVGTLLLLLCSPVAVWLAEHNGLTIIQVNLSGSQDVPFAPVVARPPNHAHLPSKGFSFEGREIGPQSREHHNQGTAEQRSASASQRPIIVTAQNSSIAPWWQVMGIAMASLWAIGAAMGLVRLTWGFLALARFSRRLEPASDPRLESLARRAANALGLREPPPLFFSRCIGVPLSIGLRRPAVVLPEGMAREADDDQLLAVLLHETAHIRRRDHWMGVGQRIASVLFWWNPMVHWVCGGISELREEICDNYVVLVQGEGERLARMLVDLAAQVALRPLLPSTVGVLEPPTAGLTGRVTRLLNKERNMATRMALRSKVLVLACALVALIGMASVGGLRLANSMAPTVTTRGSIVAIDTGEPVSGAAVTVVSMAPGGNRVQEAVSDTQGRFTFRVLPGRYALSVVGLPEKYSHNYCKLQSTIDPSHVVEVPEQIKEFDWPPIKLTPTKSITGRVIDQNDQPVADGMMFIAEGRAAYGVTLIDDKGGFTMNKVPTMIDAGKATYQISVPAKKRVPNRPTGSGLVDSEVIQADPLVIRAQLPMEKDLVEMFRQYSELSGGTFPDELDPEWFFTLFTAENRSFTYSKPQDNVSAAEFLVKLERGLMFVRLLPLESDWHYVGKGVSVEGADTPICWYRPKDSKKYRVIYADLSVRAADTPPRVPVALP